MRRDGDNQDFEAGGDRVVEPVDGYQGMTQITRGGRCFQTAGVGPEAVARVEAFAMAAFGIGAPVDCPPRWQAVDVY